MFLFSRPFVHSLIYFFPSPVGQFAQKQHFEAIVLFRYYYGRWLSTCRRSEHEIDTHLPRATPPPTTAPSRTRGKFKACRDGRQIYWGDG